MLTTSLLSLVPEAPDALSDDDVSLDAELLSSVEVVSLVELADEAPLLEALALEVLALEVLLLEALAVIIPAGGGGGIMAVSAVSPEVEDAVVSLVEFAADEFADDEEADVDEA